MKTAVEFVFDAVYKDIPYPELLGLIAQAKIIEKQQQGYSEEDLECAWNSSDQNMRFQFSSSAYKGITFKQWLEKFKQEKDVINR